MQIPVLMYHKVIKGRQIGNKYEITRDKFKEQMQYLKENGYNAISIEDLKNDLSGYKKPIMITFDDGSETDFTVVFPVIQEYGLKSIHFIPTDYIGRERSMNWDQVRQLENEGASIQSHTITHRQLDRLPEEEIKKELILSKDKIEKEMGRIPIALALPMGSRPQRIRQLLEECEYRYLFTSRPCINNFTGNEAVSEFGRIRITDSIDLKHFEEVLTLGSFFYRKEQLIFMIKKPLKKIFKIILKNK